MSILEREREMVFPDYYFFAERYLVNHTIEKKRVNNLDDCELMYCKLLQGELRNNSLIESYHQRTLKAGSLLTNWGFCELLSSYGSLIETKMLLSLVDILFMYFFLCFFLSLRQILINAFTGKCHKEATCYITCGSYVCTCKSGFIGDEHDCTRNRQ